MTVVDGDGIDQDLTRAVSAAMIAAARAGEQIAGMNQTAARQREARAAGDTIEAQRQLDAHTESARAYFEIVTRPEYLAVATAEQICDVAQNAEGWRKWLPEAQRAADMSFREVQERRPEQVDERAAVVEQLARRAASTAEVAQARPAGEATAVAQRDLASRTWSRPVGMRSQQKGVVR